MGAHRFAVVVVLGAVFGGVLAGCSDGASPGAVETVADLQGTWSDEETWSDDLSLWPTPPPSWGPTTLTVTDCIVGEECGRLERFERALVRCVYELVYRSEDADGINFETGIGNSETGIGNSFECGWSPWPNTVLRVTPGPDGSIEIVAGGSDRTATTLRRAED